jgi:hypothetical protein
LLGVRSYLVLALIGTVETGIFSRISVNSRKIKLFQIIGAQSNVQMVKETYWNRPTLLCCRLFWWLLRSEKRDSESGKEGAVTTGGEGVGAK